MPDIRYCKSVGEHQAYQSAVNELIVAEVRRAKMKVRTAADEQTLPVVLAEASISAAWAALIAVIDAYSAEKVSDAINQARMVHVDLLSSKRKDRT